MNYVLNFDKLKNLCQSQGFSSLKALCAKANIHQNSLTPYIKRARSPFTQVVLDLATALNVPVIDLICINDDKEITQVKEVIAPFLPERCAVFLFGSRARGTQKKFTDIDLGITGGKDVLTFSRFSIIKSEIDDAFDNYPLSVNLTNLDIAPTDFIEEVARDLRFLTGDEKAAYYFLGYIDGRKEN